MGASRPGVRAFLFGWNPKSRGSSWPDLSELVAARAGEDPGWYTRSTKLSVGDRAFGIKLGPGGRGIFGRGDVKELKEEVGRREVVIQWRELLDPRVRANLMAFPVARGSAKQHWTPQSNGTEVAKYPVAQLQRLWEAHYRERTQRGQVGSDIQDVLAAPRIAPTVKQRLVDARLGQGRFRDDVLKLECACRVTGVSDTRHLRASHIKPWRASSDKERLDGSNGLMLAPHIDHLFDRGFISFSPKGKLLRSPYLDYEVLARWSIHLKVSVGTFAGAQRRYLAFHRKHVFLR